jgi:hypothetical protein
VDQTLHTHVSKCTNNKIKGEKNQNAILMWAKFGVQTTHSFSMKIKNKNKNNATNMSRDRQYMMSNI